MYEPRQMSSKSFNVAELQQIKVHTWVRVHQLLVVKLFKWLSGGDLGSYKERRTVSEGFWEEDTKLQYPGRNLEILYIQDLLEITETQGIMIIWVRK